MQYADNQDAVISHLIEHNMETLLEPPEPGTQVLYPSPDLRIFNQAIEARFEISEI